MTEPKEPISPQEMSPQATYSSLLPRYNALTKQTRQAEAMQNPDLARQLSLQSTELHDKIAAIGIALGRDRLRVRVDLMLTEGNLDIYEVPELPLLQLPLTSFTQKTDLARDIKSKPLIPKIFTLFNQNGEIVYSILPPSGADPKETHIKPHEKGSRSETEKWRSGEFMLIPFYVKSNNVTTPLPNLSLNRMLRLAKNKGLRIYSGKTGHATALDGGDADEIIGVEVPSDRVEEIAIAIRNNREKYYLTDDELANPGRIDEEYREKHYELLSRFERLLAIQSATPTDWLTLFQSLDTIKDGLTGYMRKGWIQNIIGERESLPPGANKKGARRSRFKPVLSKLDKSDPIYPELTALKDKIISDLLSSPFQ